MMEVTMVSKDLIRPVGATSFVSWILDANTAFLPVLLFTKAVVLASMSDGSSDLTREVFHSSNRVCPWAGRLSQSCDGHCPD